METLESTKMQGKHTNDIVDIKQSTCRLGLIFTISLVSHLPLAVDGGGILVVSVSVALPRFPRAAAL